MAGYPLPHPPRLHTSDKNKDGKMSLNEFKALVNNPHTPPLSMIIHQTRTKTAR